MEYVSSAFHTGLTKDQSEDLERMQQMSLKTIYDFKKSYAECLELAGIEPLNVRRQTLFESFTRKCFESERFNTKWFEQKQESRYGLRRQAAVVEEFALWDRLQNAPIYKMRKRINDVRKNGGSCNYIIVY